MLGLLSNPAYAGAYVFGRYRSRRTVDPDGTIRTRTVELPREEWPVLIRDHHPAYISWERFLANAERLAANCTHRRSRPAREGSALLQGIVLCGACGGAMSTVYPSGKAAYDCSHARADHAQRPGCRSILAEVVDRPVVERLLEVVVPEEIALALAAADEVAERQARTRRARELRAERARYDATRAERAFHLCDPENRLVARSLEQRWEEKLQELAEAERELACEAAQKPTPTRDEIEALAGDFPRLWAAPSTSDKDRKRLLRTVIADVTLGSEPAGRPVEIGIRWRSGAVEKRMVLRPVSAAISRRTPQAVIEYVQRHGPRYGDAELADRLNASGFSTGTGRPFDAAAVQWIRYAYGIASPPLLAQGECSVKQVADRLGVSESAVYYWISRGQLTARRGAGGRLCVPFAPEVERACRERIARSNRIVTRTRNPAAGGAV